MKEIHGVRVKRLTALGPADDQEVEVEDFGGGVLLRMGASPFPAMLTPDEARFLARALNASADRAALRVRMSTSAERAAWRARRR